MASTHFPASAAHPMPIPLQIHTEGVPEHSEFSAAHTASVGSDGFNVQGAPRTASGMFNTHTFPDAAHPALQVHVGLVVPVHSVFSTTHTACSGKVGLSTQSPPRPTP